jgi:hypothetical protein
MVMLCSGVSGVRLGPGVRVEPEVGTRADTRARA